MHDTITERLVQLKQQQLYLMQEHAKVVGAIAVLEQLVQELAAAGTSDTTCVDGAGARDG